MFFSVSYKKNRIVRVAVTYSPNGIAGGTGFFINKKGDLLTCFHVVFGQELRTIRQNNVLSGINGVDEHEKLKNFIKQKLAKIEIELFNNSKIEVELKNFNEKYDIALLSVKNPSNYRFFKLNLKKNIDYGDNVLFGGFPNAIGYANNKTPFALTRGTVSTFVDTQIGGEKYPHIQINGVNLPGNSGGPLLLGNSDRVVGIINGNWTTGVNGQFMGVNGKPAQLSFQIPLGITYATSLNVIKSKTNVLDFI